MTTPETSSDQQREHQKEVLISMIDLFDSLGTPEAKREVLAFLASSAGVEIKSAPAARPGSSYGYRKTAKRRYS